MTAKATMQMVLINCRSQKRFFSVALAARRQKGSHQRSRIKAELEFRDKSSRVIRRIICVFVGAF